MSAVSSAGPLRAVLFPAGTTGVSIPIPADGRLNWTFYLTASAALSAGTFVIEECDYNPQVNTVPATWSQVASVTLATPFASTGGVYAYHLQQACYGYLRGRIGTTAVGGTLTASVKGV